MTIKTAETYHVPVLLNESIDGLALKPGGIYVDVTFGGGGHSREILSRLTGGARLFSFDQDADAENNIPADAEGFTFVRSNFRYLKNWMRYYGIDHIDGLLADLGVSSHHFDDAERGFSFRFDAPLYMRMNKRAGMTAADILNTYDEEQLADVFYIYGELKNSRRIAAAVAKARTTKKIATTNDFMDIAAPLFKREREKKDMTKLFQALRIEVNHEMDALKEMLLAATELLAPEGRLSVIRPRREEHHENGQRGRKGGAGLLRTHTDTVPPREQQGDNTVGRRTGEESEKPQRETQNCRKEMKQNEDNTKPDPRQILNDIAAREAEAAAGDTVKTAKGSGGDDGTDRTEPAQKGDGNAKDTQKQAAAKGNGGNGTADSFLSIIRGQAEENETGNVSDMSLAKVIGGDILKAKFIRRQMGVIMIAFVFTIIYISNRYSCQQSLIKIDKLNKELQDAKYRALSSNSELTEQSRESKVLEKLRSNKDSVLHIPTQPPYIITIPTND